MGAKESKSYGFCEALRNFSEMTGCFVTDQGYMGAFGTECSRLLGEVNDIRLQRGCGKPLHNDRSA